ncbi:MAG: cupin-like domain-containing protein [Bacteroidetes bacterium]|nr:cupin-like domain-containing protein [Bacteroidota bacterium]
MESVMASTEEKPSHYLNEVNIHNDFPELLPDVEPFLSYALPDRLMTPFMPDTWGMRKGVVELLIGGKGTKFPTLHYDGFHMNTFVTQIRGDKEFICIHPIKPNTCIPCMKAPTNRW